MNEDLKIKEEEINRLYEKKLIEYNKVMAEVNKEFDELKKKSAELDEAHEKFSAIEKEVEKFSGIMKPIDYEVDMNQAQEDLQEVMERYSKLREVNEILKPLETYLQKCITAYPLKFSINSVDELMSYVLNQLSTRNMLATQLNTINEESSAYLNRLKIETEGLDLKKLQGLSNLSQNMINEPSSLELEEVRKEIEATTKKKEIELDNLVQLITSISTVSKWAVMSRSLYTPNEKTGNIQPINSDDAIKIVKNMTIRKQLDLIANTLSYCAMLLAELMTPTGKAGYSEQIITNTDDIRRVSLKQLSETILEELK